MEDTYIVHLSKRKKNDGQEVPSLPLAINTHDPLPPTPPHVVGTTGTVKVADKLPIALHITDHEIYALQVTHAGELTRFGKSILPEKTIENGIILEQEKLVGCIRALIEEVLPEARDSKGLQGLLCIPKSQTYIQHFSLPITREPLTYETVSLKLSKLLPFSMSEVSIAFTHWEYAEEQHIISVVVPHAVTDSYTSTLELAGITPVLIDIGARTTALNSYAGQELVGSVFAPVGSDKLIEILNEAHSGKDAENQKTFEDITATLIQAIKLILQEPHGTPQNSTIEII